MSDHEDVLLQQAETWERYGGFPEGASAIRATLAELAALRAEVGILSAAKAGARYIAERDTLRQRLADIEAGHGMRAHECCDEVIRLRQRLAEVEREREALISSRNNVEEELRRAGLSEVGPPFLRVSKLRQRAERAEKALRPFAAFADAWDRKPIRGIHDEVYAIHAGADRGVLRLSDCKAARAALAPVAEQPQPELPCGGTICPRIQCSTACRWFPGLVIDGQLVYWGTPQLPALSAKPTDPSGYACAPCRTAGYSACSCALKSAPVAPQPAKASTEPPDPCAGDGDAEPDDDEADHV
jgi:hypothetical protein